MRTRKWVLYIFAVCVVCGILLFEGVRVLERRSGLADYVATHVLPGFEGEIDTEQIRFGFFSVSVRQLRVTLPAGALAVEVQDITVGFSLGQFILSGFDFTHALDRVILVRPAIILNTDKLGEAQAVSCPDTTAGSAARFDVTSMIADMPLQQLQVRDASVMLRTGNANDSFAIENAISGILHKRDSAITVVLDGRVGSLKKNISVSGRLGTPRCAGPDSIQVHIDNAHLDLPGSIRGLDDIDATITANIVVRFPGIDSLSGTRINGALALRNTTVSHKALPGPITGGHGHFRIDENALYIDSLAASWQGNRIYAVGSWDPTGSGAAPNRIDIFAAECAYTMDASDNSGSNGFFSNTSTHRIACSDVRAIVRGDTLDFPRKMEIHTGTVRYDEYEALTRASARIHVHDSHIRLVSLHGEGTSGRVSAYGNLDLPDSATQMESRLYFSHAAGLPSFYPAAQGSLFVNGTVSGEGDGFVLNASANGRGIRIGGIEFGNPALTLFSDDFDTLSCTGVPRDDDLFRMHATLLLHKGKTPYCRAVIHLRDTFFTQWDDPVPAFAAVSIDSVSSRLDFKGWINAFDAEGSVSVQGTGIGGSLSCWAHKEEGEDIVGFGLKNNGLKANERNVPLQVRGDVTFSNNKITIHESHALNGIGAFGHVAFFPQQEPRVDMAFVYRRFSIAEALGWLYGDSILTADGYINGETRLHGPLSGLHTVSDIDITDARIASQKHLSASLHMVTTGDTFTIAPFTVRKGDTSVIEVAYVQNGRDAGTSGSFGPLDIGTILDPMLAKVMPDSASIGAEVQGRFSSSGQRLFPVMVTFGCDTVSIRSKWYMNDLAIHSTLDMHGISVDSLQFRDSNRSGVYAQARLPYRLITGTMADTDTARARIALRGDILASFEKNVPLIIGGNGKGEVECSLLYTRDSMVVEKGLLHIPKARISADYFLYKDITSASISARVDRKMRVHTDIRGTIGRSPVRIFTTHDSIPSGYYPLVVGPLDFGLLQVTTPDGGIDVHLPGLMDLGETGDIVFRPKPPFDAFTISGPFHKAAITGEWMVRNARITYPPLEKEQLPFDFDPFPYIQWDFDFTIGNRNVWYYWGLRGKKHDFVRFFEGRVTPGSRMSFHGRDKDHTFRITGELTANAGHIYYGEMFDRRLRAGAEFRPQKYEHSPGYDNLPIVWAQAEAFSDTSRFDRTKIEIKVQDPVTKTVHDKGRMALISPGSMSNKSGIWNLGPALDSIPNFVIAISSNAEKDSGAHQQRFYRQAGDIFEHEARRAVSRFGEHYLQSYLFRRFERSIEQSLGLHLVDFETSFASNYFYYFYDRENDGSAKPWWLLENAGVTVGHFFYNDYILFKAGSGLKEYDLTMHPQYNVGIEFMPTSYFAMDVNYGIFRADRQMHYRPHFSMQLEMPLNLLTK